MPSSQFRSRIPFRPTPQTCYPPPPPPTNPGFVPCLQTEFDKLATIQLHSTMELFGHLELPPIRAIGTNIATVNLAPGLVQWTARISSGFLTDMTVGIRCIRDAYGLHTWQTMLTGRVTSPTGLVIAGNLPWHNSSNAVSSFDGYAREVNWHESNIASWVTPTWRMISAISTLREVPDTSRSRPPNPPIPSLG